MNKNRRKNIQKIKDKLLDFQSGIEAIRDEEQEAYDNLSESLQNNPNGEKMSEAIDNLESALTSLEDVAEYLDQAMQ